MGVLFGERVGAPAPATAFNTEAFKNLADALPTYAVNHGNGPERVAVQIGGFDIEIAVVIADGVLHGHI